MLGASTVLVEGIPQTEMVLVRPNVLRGAARSPVGTNVAFLATLAAIGARSRDSDAIASEAVLHLSEAECSNKKGRICVEYGAIHK